jgi:cytochrome b
MTLPRETDVRVWDPFVRVFHWTLVLAFTVSFVTEDEMLGVHVWAGYGVGALLAMRVFWGFVGSPHARFADFVYRPSEVLAYLRSLLTFSSRRYVGHSPGGGAMVLALLVSLSLTTISGLAVYGADRHAGPLAGWFDSPSVSEPASYQGVREGGEADHDEDRERAHRGLAAELLEELHEFLANLSLALVILHVAAVVFVSVSHGENLVRAMITGRKRR